MSSSEVALPLTGDESVRLAECEVVIERGMGVFVEVGEALMIVRDERLYRDTHGTFEEYCRERWSLSVPYANQLISAARVIETISDAIAPEIILPATESQARELAPLLDDPEELREVWAEAVERTEGKPTAAAIRTVRQEREVPQPEPDTSARDEVAEAMDLHLPPDDPWRGWRASYLRDLAAAYRLISLQTPDQVCERADDECLDEFRRFVREVDAYADRLKRAISSRYGDNVRVLRSAR